MIARASTVEATAGAERLTQVAFSAEAKVEAHWDGEAVPGDGAADRLDDGHVLQARDLQVVPTAITVRPLVTASVSPDFRNLRRASEPRDPAGRTASDRRPRWERQSSRAD